MSNQGRFYDRFDAVVLLSAPAELILGRIESRTTNSYGKTADEREAILQDIASAEPQAAGNLHAEIDATHPIGQIVETLIAIGSTQPTTPEAIEKCALAWTGVQDVPVDGLGFLVVPGTYASQVGIGASPDAVAAEAADHGVGRYVMHTARTRGRKRNPCDS